MVVEKRVDCPLPDDFPLSISIRIWHSNEKYQVYISSDYSEDSEKPKDPDEIELNKYQVNVINTELQSRIQGVSVTVKETGGNAEGYHKALSKLAKTGRASFNKIFTRGKLRNKIHERLRTDATIQVVSEDFFIPWELLYDGPLYDQVDACYFWGMQYVVLRVLTPGAGSGDFASSTLPPMPLVGLAYDELPYVLHKEIPTLTNFEQKEKIRLSRLSSLAPQKQREGLAEFDHFLRKDIDILHLACHAHQGELPSDTYFRVSKVFPITMEDFDAEEFEIEHNPLVFLNACRTGTISPLYASGWAMIFCKCGARGVLATEFRVSDWFAAVFIEELYNHLLAGKAIGEALLAARREFSRKKNPLGLGYAFYASRPSIKIGGQGEEL